MATELMTSWGEYQAAIDRLLGLAAHELRIYDNDLARLGLETAARSEMLKRILSSNRGICLKIAVRDEEFFINRAPRLLTLLRNHNHHVAIQKTPDSLAQLRDGMLLADGCHALVLFEQGQPRCKLIVDDMNETQNYMQRFDEIWHSGCSPISMGVAGL